MSQTIEAIYEHGAFKPLSPVELPERTHVRLDVEPSTTDLDEHVRRELLAKGVPHEAIERALATLHQLTQCFEGLTEEQLRIMDDARLDQVNFFNRPED
jgi:predicted DNA-binding antitoxin AbrB/MazE fold protein